MDSKQIARIQAIRKSIRARASAANDGAPATKTGNRRATVDVTHDPLLVACVEAAGFEEHREAA